MSIRESAFSCFIRQVIAETRRKGAYIVHLKPNGVHPTRLAEILNSEGLTAQTDGNRVICAIAR